MIILDNDSTTPLYIQIYEQIKEKIASGEILEGDKLTSTRRLSSELNISRNTVENAYMQLSSEGYVSSKVGSGFVVENLDNSIISKLKREDITVAKNIMLDVNYSFNNNNSYNCDDGYNYKYNFEYGKLSAQDFPLRIWKRISNKCLSAISAEDMVSYSSSKGELDLQIEIMNHLRKSRGVSCNYKQIIISSGMEYCLSLLCQLIRDDFHNIALEDPGYIGAKDIFINNGYNVIPISLEEDGINLDELENSSAKIVYVTPSHQFPTGTVIPIAKRLKLIDWAIRNNGVIIEDDYDSELRYNSKPIPSIQSIDSKGVVVYVGTFSKAFSPSMRLNYMVLPETWLEKYHKRFKMYQVSVPLIQQKIIQQFMHLGHFDRHLRKINLINKKKHDILVHAIQEFMGDNVIIHGRNAGLHILLEFNNGLTEKELILRAKNHRVKVYPVSMFWMREDNYPNNMVLLGFGGMPECDIVQGIKVLKEAWLMS
ncbi:PLP-dependent aminotransferase family protein [Clostridium beijerinckii]|nr:PLP-dependent aminotransferase family protein [Clostridium beijerinckii]